MAYVKTARSICRLRTVNGCLRDVLCVPVVDPHLKKMMSDHRPVVREMAYRQLEVVASQGSSDAVRMITGLLGSDDESQELRKWAFDGILLLADPGEAWAIDAIIRQGGPLQSSNQNIRIKALRTLPLLDMGQAATLEAAQASLTDGVDDVRRAATSALGLMKETRTRRADTDSAPPDQEGSTMQQKRSAGVSQRL